MALSEINMNQNVKTVEQTLTTEQKGQARTNIGAGDAATLATLQALVEETFADMFLVREHTVTYSFSANEYKSFKAADFSPAIEDIEGYTRVGIVGFGSGYSQSITYLLRGDASGDTNVISVRNTGTAQNNRTVMVRVLYVKSSLVEGATSTETT